MKRLLIPISVLSLLAMGPAQAQQSQGTQVPAATDSSMKKPETVEEACIFVAKSVLMVNDLKIGVVQAFPELDPPGARLTYTTRMDSKPEDISDEIECQFEGGAEPLQVTRFCMDLTCYAANSEEPEERRRFEEVRALMQPSGLIPLAFFSSPGVSPCTGIADWLKGTGCRTGVRRKAFPAERCSHGISN